MHYYCAGTCFGVSTEPGKCHARDCAYVHQELSQCECIENVHKQAEKELALEIAADIKKEPLK